jgi:hypothetical protein
MKIFCHTVFLNFLLACNLLHPGFACAADWESVSGRNTLGTAFYVDTDAVIDNYPFISILALEDRASSKYFKVNGVGMKYRSYIARRIIDCNKKSSVIESGVFYSGRMGAGRVLHSFSEVVTEDSFATIPSGTWSEALYEYACDKVKPPKKLT